MFKENVKNFSKERESKHQVLFSGLNNKMKKKRSRTKIPNKPSQRVLSSAAASKKNIRNPSLHRARAESKKRGRRAFNNSEFDTNEAKQKSVSRQNSKQYHDSSRNNEMKRNTREANKKFEYYSLLSKKNTGSKKKLGMQANNLRNKTDSQSMRINNSVPNSAKPEKEETKDKSKEDIDALEHLNYMNA